MELNALLQLSFLTDERSIKKITVLYLFQEMHTLPSLLCFLLCQAYCNYQHI